MKLTLEETKKLNLLIKSIRLSNSMGGLILSNEVVYSPDDTILIDLLQRILREATVE